MPKHWPLIATLAALLALLPGLTGTALAAPTPGAQGLNNPPELQDAVKERNLKAPGRLTGQAPARTLGKMPAPAKARVPAKTGPEGRETPQSFRERHRLHPGAAGGQGSRDVFLNQRIQGRQPTGLQRRPVPPKKEPAAKEAEQPNPAGGGQAPAAGEP